MSAHVGRKTMDELSRCIRDTHTSLYATISESVEDNMEMLVAELFSRSIISKAARKSKNYSKVTNEFWAGLLFKKSVKDIESHCVEFLESLQAIGPIGRGAADELGNKWQTEVQRKLAISFLSSYYRSSSKKLIFY